MESLRNLVVERGTTICSVIHQPRKFIYELFDSLILLGVGGNMVYHGPVDEAEKYFNKLNYELPAGESIADWLIDISSGSLEPTTSSSSSHGDGQRSRLPSHDEIDADSISSAMDAPSFGFDSAMLSSAEGAALHVTSRASSLDNAAQIFEDAATRAKSRREELHQKWNSHFANLFEDERQKYAAPIPSALPASIERAPFSSQLFYQLQRLMIVGERNWLTKLIDTLVIVAAVVLISVLDGTERPTYGADTGKLNYGSIAEPSSVRELIMEFPKLFEFAMSANIENLQGYVVNITNLPFLTLPYPTSPSSILTDLFCVDTV